MVNSTKLEIVPSRNTFIFGNCVEVSIGEMFGINPSMVRTMFFLAGIKYGKGHTNREIGKIIRAICKCSDEYIVIGLSNINITVYELAKRIKNVNFIATNDNHCTCFKDGKFIDTYLKTLPNKVHKRLSYAWLIIPKYIIFQKNRPKTREEFLKKIKSYDISRNHYTQD